MAVKESGDAQTGEGSAEAGGYKQELKRTLGSFQVFAVSFAFISVAVGIFGTYDDVLQNAGPIGIWLWPVIAVGQTLIALVIAQFAARIPLSGSSYQWASRLANPKIGWLFGWLGFCYLAIGVVAADNALAITALMPLLGKPAGREHCARSHARRSGHSGRARRALDAARRTDHIGRGGARTGHRRRADGRALHRRGCYRRRRGQQPHLARYR